MTDLQKKTEIYFGSESYEILLSYGISEETIMNEINLLESNSSLYRTSEVLDSIYKAEEKLQSKSKGGITQEFFRANLSSETQSGFFMTDTSIKKILSVLPPLELIKIHKCNNLEELFEYNNPRFLLSVCRHTENSTWQNEYRSLITKLSKDDFEEREISINVLDNSLFSEYFENNKRETKPWRLSHNKETGSITIYKTEINSAATPLLLKLAVFLHYANEVNFASEFFLLNSKNEEEFGSKVAKLIHNERSSFSFLTDKNIYDETLYWDLAIDTICSKFNHDNLSHFCRTSETAKIVHGETKSFNFVDILWEINLNFENTTYHFKQSLWTKIIRNHSGLSNTEYKNIIIGNLEKNDMEITRELLQSKV